MRWLAGAPILLLVVAIVACDSGPEPPHAPAPAADSTPPPAQRVDQPDPPAPRDSPTATTTGSIAAPAAPVMVTPRSDVPLYAGPGVDWRRIGLVDAGTTLTLRRVTITDPAGELWLELDAPAGWATAADLGLTPEQIASVPRAPAVDVVALVGPGGAALYPAPTADRPPERDLPAGQRIQLAGRSPDARWLAGTTTLTNDEGHTFWASGWLPAERVAVPVPTGDLPLYAAHPTILVLDAATGPSGAGGPPPAHVVSRQDLPALYTSNRAGFGVQPWGWTDAGLTYLDGTAVRTFDPVSGQSTVYRAPAVIDFVPSPDGQTLAAATGELPSFQLWLTDPRGATEVGVWTPSAAPPGDFLRSDAVWSPDGAALAVESVVLDETGRPQGRSEITVVRPGAGPPLVAAGHEPAWTPSGDLVFIDDDLLQRLGPDGAAKPFATPVPATSFLVAPAGDRIAVGHREQVHVIDTTGAVVAELGGGHVYSDVFEWAPDGSAIAFTEAVSPFTDAPAVWTPNGGVRRLGERGGIIGWSPDGTQLAYSAEGVDRVVEQLASGASFPIAPGRAIWSPDGRQLAVLIFQHQVRVYDATTGALRWAVHIFGGCGRQAAWSPDGRWLAVGDELIGCL